MMSSNGAAVVLAGALALVALRDWRLGVKLVLVMVVIEGALRKWFFPDAQQLLYFAKDGILLAAFLGYLRTRGPRLIGPRPIWHLVGILGIIGLLEIFNPALPSLTLGLLGLKSYVFYCVLLVLVPATWSRLEDLEKFLRRYLLLTIPTTILALIQFQQPVESVWNRYANESLEAAATFGTVTTVRVTSSFPYISGYTSYLFFMVIIALALLAAGQWTLRGNVLLWVAGFAALAAMPMTGSRWPVYVLAAAVPLFALLLLARGFLKVGVALRALAGSALIGVLLAALMPGPISLFRERMGSAGDEGRVLASYYQVLDAAELIGFAGYGTGATHNAATVIVTDMIPYSWLESAAWRFEDEFARIIVELGLAGLFVVLAIRFNLIGFSFRQLKAARDRLDYCLAAAACLYFLSHINAHVIFNSTEGVYFWFFAGIVVIISRGGLVHIQHPKATDSNIVHQNPDCSPWPATLAPGGIRAL